MKPLKTPTVFYAALALAFYLHGLPGWAVALAAFLVLDTITEA